MRATTAVQTTRKRLTSSADSSGTESILSHQTTASVQTPRQHTASLKAQLEKEKKAHQAARAKILKNEKAAKAKTAQFQKNVQKEISKLKGDIVAVEKKLKIDVSKISEASNKRKAEVHAYVFIYMFVQSHPLHSQNIYRYRHET